MLENILVILIILIVAAILVFSFYRTLTGKKSACSCSSKCNKDFCNTDINLDEDNGDA